MIRLITILTLLFIIYVLTSCGNDNNNPVQQYTLEVKHLSGNKDTIIVHSWCQPELSVFRDEAVACIFLNDDGEDYAACYVESFKTLKVE